MVLVDTMILDSIKQRKVVKYSNLEFQSCTSQFLFLTMWDFYETEKLKAKRIIQIVLLTRGNICSLINQLMLQLAKLDNLLR